MADETGTPMGRQGHAEARAVLERHLPGVADSPQLGMAAGFALTQAAGLSPE